MLTTVTHLAIFKTDENEKNKSTEKIARGAENVELPFLLFVLRRRLSVSVSVRAKRNRKCTENKSDLIHFHILYSVIFIRREREWGRVGQRTRGAHRARLFRIHMSPGTMAHWHM